MNEDTSLHSLLVSPSTFEDFPLLVNAKDVWGENVNEISLHSPSAPTSTPAHVAMHAFEYVMPSLPHTGFMILAHTQSLVDDFVGVAVVAMVGLVPAGSGCGDKQD